MVARRLCVAGQVGMRETRFALHPVALAVKLLSGGEPLVRLQRVIAFVHLSVPADSAMEPLGFASDELSLETSLVLLPQPVEVAEPYEGRNVLDVRHEAGIPVIRGPAPHDSVQGRQSVVLVHPRPISGSQVFELPFHSLLCLGRRSKMHRPPVAVSPPLDVKTQEVEPVIDVGDDSLFFRQCQVEFVLQKLLYGRFGGLDLGFGAVADDHEVVRVTHHLVVAETRPSSPLSSVNVEVPLCRGPPIKLVEVDVG